MADWDVWNWTRTHLEWNQRKTHVSSTSTGTTTYQKYYQTQSNGNWSNMCLVSVTPPLRTCATIGQPLKSIQARIGVFLVPPTRSNPIQANPSSAVNDLKEAKEWGILSRFSRDNFRTLQVIFLTIIIAGYHQPAAAAVIQLEYKKKSNRGRKCCCWPLLLLLPVSLWKPLSASPPASTLIRWPWSVGSKADGR